jgi:DNA-directed RNA polymerase subunit E'/Rpb7
MRNMPIKYIEYWCMRILICLSADILFQVIQKIGLCICLYDILKASDGLIGHGTGIANVNGQ